MGLAAFKMLNPIHEPSFIGISETSLSNDAPGNEKSMHTTINSNFFGNDYGGEVSRNEFKPHSINIFDDKLNNNVVDVSEIKNKSKNRKDGFLDKYKTATGKLMMTDLQEQQFADLEEVLYGKKLYVPKAASTKKH